MTFRPIARAAKLRARKWESPAGLRSRIALDRASNRRMAASRSAGLMLRVRARRTRSRESKLTPVVESSLRTPSFYHHPRHPSKPSGFGGLTQQPKGRTSGQRATLRMMSLSSQVRPRLGTVTCLSKRLPSALVAPVKPGVLTACLPEDGEAKDLGWLLQAPGAVAGPLGKPPAQAGGSSGQAPGSRPGLLRSFLTPTE